MESSLISFIPIQTGRIVLQEPTGEFIKRAVHYNSPISLERQVPQET